MNIETFYDRGSTYRPTVVLLTNDGVPERRK